MLNSHLKAYVIQYTKKRLLNDPKRPKTISEHSRYGQYDRIIFCTPRKVEYISWLTKNSDFYSFFRQ